MILLIDTFNGSRVKDSPLFVNTSIKSSIFLLRIIIVFTVLFLKGNLEWGISFTLALFSLEPTFFQMQDLIFKHFFSLKGFFTICIFSCQFSVLLSLKNQFLRSTHLKLLSYLLVRGMREVVLGLTFFMFCMHVFLEICFITN